MRRSRRQTKIFVIMVVLTVICFVIGSACSKPAEASNDYKRIIISEYNSSLNYGYHDRYYVLTDTKTDKNYLIFVSGNDSTSTPVLIELEDN